MSIEDTYKAAAANSHEVGLQAVYNAGYLDGYAAGAAAERGQQQPEPDAPANG